MKTALRAGLSFAALAVAASCQTYDFEPVTPLAIAQTTMPYTITAQQLKPDLMILLDKSGSMAAPLPGGTNCGSCMFPACPEGTCPTRMGQVRSAMNTFLMGNGNVARMGLTIYPADNVCTAAGTQQQLTPIRPMTDNDPDLQAWANGINMQIQTQTVGGGTPTGGSLNFVGTIAELNDPQRQDFVLLLTDGLPNCNTANPNVCTTPAACRCTLQGGNCGTVVNDADPNNFCRRGCLDIDGAVQAVKDLRTRDIKTIVVGFGSDFGSGDGFEALNAMAIAGGFQRTCPNMTNTECGTGGVCVSGVCQTAFYSAGNAAELAAALAQISAALSGDSICRYTLDAIPSSPDLVSVIVDGTPTQSGPNTWQIMGAQLVFPDTGPMSTCARLKMSTTVNPVKLEIRIVQTL